MGVGERVAPKRSCGKTRAGGGPPASAEEEAGLRAQIGVPPAVEDDAGNVALRIKSNGRKHLRELLADTAFVFAERRGEKFATTAMTLRFGGQTWIRE